MRTISNPLRKMIVALILAWSPWASALVVLQYHHISENAPHATTISPDLFEAHLDFLEKNKFSVIDIGELETMLKSKKGLPDRAVIITFDDGYRSIYSEAYPRLKKRGWPFTVFVNSKPHDEKNPRFMTWKQLKKISKNGATIGNHTDSHLHMIRRQPNESTPDWLDRMEREIDFAEKRIKQEIGSAPRYFAWPYGEYNGDLQRLLAKKDYLAFGQQSGPISQDSDPQALPRFPFGGNYGEMDDFRVKVMSLPLPLNSVRTEAAGHGHFSDPLLPKGVDIPVLRINTPLARVLKNFQCFASGQGKISTEVQSSTIVVKAKRPLNSGRSRYNCTADSGSGRFYWYSHLFIRKNPDGSWYQE